MIRVRGLTKTYRTREHVNEVLRGVDLDIDEGELLAVVGRSGSGKTTLINVIGGLDRDYGGLVEVEGQDLRQLSERELAAYRNARVGFVFQSFHLLEHLTLAENAALPASFMPRPIPPAEARARALEVLDKVGLRERADDLPRNLSGGQKQRVAIARALFNRPRLMVCDEPTGNLDLETATAILDLFTGLNRDEGVTLIVVTHDDLVARAAARCVRVHEGRVHEIPSDALADRGRVAPAPHPDTEGEAGRPKGEEVSA